MNFFESSLIHVARAVLAGWEWVKTFFAWLGGVLEAILQPILSPLLRVLNPLCTKAADLVYKLLAPFPPWVGLVLISAAAGVVMLIAFRYLSNQKGISRAKDDIKANLLALKLFKDDLGVAFRAQGRILWALMRLQRYILVPVLWMALPMMLLLAQMAMRYQWSPLKVGDQALLKVYCDGAAEWAATARVEPHAFLDEQVGPIAGADDIAWRLRVLEPGSHVLRIQMQGAFFEKEIVAGTPLKRVSPLRPDFRWTSQLLYPIEAPLTPSKGKGAQSQVPDGGEAIHSIEISYPELDSMVYGSDYWVLTFFVVSMLTAIALKPLFKVRF